MVNVINDEQHYSVGNKETLNPLIYSLLERNLSSVTKSSGSINPRKFSFRVNRISERGRRTAACEPIRFAVCKANASVNFFFAPHIPWRALETRHGTALRHHRGKL